MLRMFSVRYPRGVSSIFLVCSQQAIAVEIQTMLIAAWMNMKAFPNICLSLYLSSPFMMFIGFPIDEKNAGARPVTVESAMMRITLHMISAGFENIEISVSNMAEAFS